MNLKDYLHLYFGAKYKLSDTEGIVSLYTYDSIVNSIKRKQPVKLQLRPFISKYVTRLDFVTLSMNGIKEWPPDDDLDNDLIDFIKWTPEVARVACSLEFDIYRLISAGLAENNTKPSK
jgi:hypothetical protein